MGGHLKKVETCSVGVTWGIGYDSTAWVYTGGWGGLFLKGTYKFTPLNLNLNFFRGIKTVILCIDIRRIGQFRYKCHGRYS